MKCRRSCSRREAPAREGPEGPTGPCWHSRVGRGWTDVPWDTRRGRSPPAPVPPCLGQGPLPAVAVRRWGPQRAGSRWAVYAPVLPTRYTHPGIPHPGTPHRPTPSSCTTPPSTGTPRTCTYDSSETPVGEPRGMEHTRVSGSRTGLYSFYWFTRPFDWVYASVLLSLVSVLLSLVSVLLIYGPFH